MDCFLDSDDLWMPEKLEHQIKFMDKYNYCLSYTEYEKIDEDSNPINIYVSGPESVNKRKMYNYDYIGQLTMMYSVKVFGLIQIKDIKKIMIMPLDFSFIKNRECVHIF